MKNRENANVSAPASRRNVILGLAAVATLSAVPGIGRADTVTLTASDLITTSSFNTNLHWSDGQAPSAANDYIVAGGLTLRSPSDGGSVTFGGNSLTVGENSATSQLLLKNVTNSTITVNNLTLNKGLIANGGNAAAAATTLTLASNAITIGIGGATFDSGASGRFISVTGPMSGNGPVTVANQGGIGFTAANTYTGITTVSNGALNATDGVGLPTASPLNLAGGALATSGTFTRNFGTGNGEVVISSTGGFSANGGDLTIAIGGTAAPTPLTVGVNGFAPTNMPLNYSTATGAINFRNSVDLAGTTTFGIQTNSTTVAAGATMSGVISDSVGNGVFTKINAGLLTLTGTNTYGGRTAVNGGFLRGTDGVNIPTATNISFNGGVLAPIGSTFTRSVGTGAGQVQWFGTGATGGFTALDQDLTVALGGTASPTPLVWGTTDGFNPNIIILGGRLGTNTVTFTNAIDLSTPLATTLRTITSHGGTAVVSGLISNTGAAQGVLGFEGDGTVGAGTIIVTGANTYGGTTLIDTGGQGAAIVRATNSLSFGTSLIQFNPPGVASTARLELTNNITLANNVWFSARANQSPAIRNLSGNNTMAGTFTIQTGGSAYILQSDSGTLTLTGASGSTIGTAITGMVPGSTNPALGIRNVTLQGASNGVISGLIADGVATVGLIKAGNGTWSLTNAANGHTGATLIAGGKLEVSSLANGGAQSSIGASSNAAGNLVLAGGTLRYVGGATSTDRSFSLGVTGGTIESSGTGEVVFNNTAANVAVDAPTSATFATASNTLTLPLAGIGGVAVGQTITGAGIPAGATVTAVDYTLNTVTISANTTAAGAAGTPITVSAAPARTLTLTGTNTGANSVDGVIANAATGGVVGVAKTGPGGWTLRGANTYTGTTTVTGGTLSVNTAAAAVLLAGTGTTGGTDIQSGSVAFTGGSAATIRGLLAAGFSDATTPGVMDSGTLRSGTATTKRGLGYIDNGTAVVVKAALFGDADLDGGVSINDFNALAGNFGKSSGQVWVNGDFDYDGGISINDFNLLAGNFGQTIPASSEAWAGLLAFAAAHNDLAAFEAVTGVPEPTAIGLLAAGAMLGLRRRRSA